MFVFLLGLFMRFSIFADVSICQPAASLELPRLRYILNRTNGRGSPPTVASVVGVLICSNRSGKLFVYSQKCCLNSWQDSHHSSCDDSYIKGGVGSNETPYL